MVLASVPPPPAPTDTQERQRAKAREPIFSGYADLVEERAEPIYS